ncbi:MAG TPA: hypothetical protein VF756_01060 [Thermoanaerobaculia bacterium]
MSPHPRLSPDGGADLVVFLTLLVLPYINLGVEGVAGSAPVVRAARVAESVD